MPCHYTRINLSMGPRGFQMFVEIASRMDGRGVEYETRHDVSRGRKSRYLADRSAPNIGLFVFIRVLDVLTVIRAK